MTDLAPIIEAPSALMRFAQEASEVHGIAKALSTTSFVPKSMQGKPDEITGAILAGKELGLDPMTALASIDIIDGRPSLRANTQRGLAMAAGCVFEVVNASDELVTMRARGPMQSKWTEVSWPIDRARKMGLTNKSNWQKMPQAMLTARATSELCRLVAANVLLGMPYSREELEDASPEESSGPVMNRERPTRVRRATVDPSTVEPALSESIAVGVADTPRELSATPEPQPPAEGEWPEEVAVPGGDEGISDNTRKAIMAGFNELGMKDRAVRLNAVSAVVGREIPSVNVLTEAEGQQVMRKLQQARTVDSEAGA